MMKQRLGLYLVLMMSAAGAAWTAPARGSEVYTWTDEDGVVHYTDAAQAGRAAEIVEVEGAARPDPADATPAPAPEAAAPAAGADAEAADEIKTPAQERREKMARDRAERQAAQAETDRLCALHRQRFESMEPARRVFWTNEQGESVRLDDDQRMELIDESRDFLADNCD